MRGTLHRYGGQWNLKGYDVRDKRIVGLLGSGILLAEVRFSLTPQVSLRKLEDGAFPLAKVRVSFTAQVRLRKLEDEAFPVVKRADLLKI